MEMYIDGDGGAGASAHFTTHKHTHCIRIDEYDKYEWASHLTPACQNLLLLSLLIRYVQQQHGNR